MVRRFFPLLILLLLAGGCAAPPLQELQAARSALRAASATEAAVLAPAEYQAAQSALQEGEDLVRKKQYRLAREILPFAEAHARRAILKAGEEQANRELQKIRARELLREEQLPDEPVRMPTRQTLKAITIRKTEPPKSLPPPKAYRVQAGETLWTIAARKEIYADALLWPLLYQANRDQIRDPRQIYPGQFLSIPRQLSGAEKDAAREKARRSRIFPIAPATTPATAPAQPENSP
jgi:nucleoid-associated protein YgaU